MFSGLSNLFAMNDFQTWLNITDISAFKTSSGQPSNYLYWLELQPRFGDNSQRLTQTLIRPGLGYALTPTTSVWLGYGRIYTDKPLSVNAFKENRIWQQLLWIESFNQLTLQSRTRFEERFLENNAQVHYRLRQLVKGALFFSSNPNYYLVASEELFLKPKELDQNRFFIGMGYTINKQINAELGYLNQFINRLVTPNFTANVIALNFYLNY